MKARVDEIEAKAAGKYRMLHKFFRSAKMV
jgi:hypothetical protein